MAILSNEYVLGGIAIGLIIGSAIVWRKTRSFFNPSDKKDS
jgi:hypothetical protein